MSQKKPIELFSSTYFAMCGIGGILSCGLTHTAVTPLDLVKCNAQTNAKAFPSFVQGFKNIYSGKVNNLGFSPGLKGVVRGWAPTLVGYSLQGLCKFGFYEYFKWSYGNLIGAENSIKYKSLLYTAASSSAEFIADIALCPFEAVKVRVQTSPQFARGLVDGMGRIIREEGAGNLFAGLVPLWARQVPYTIIKFVAFERIAEGVYGAIKSSTGRTKADMNMTEQMGVVFASGYLAGIICGAVSHPADTMVSKINKVQSAGGVGEKMKIIYSGTKDAPGIGFKGLWAGFWPRVVMIGTLTGLQWFIYGAFKGAVGLPTPGAADTDEDKK
jgi:solute carrier family 25 (mitochondrial phosphate transporter), member 3